MSTIDSSVETLGAAAIFVEVADQRSFTKAARKLGMTASGVSKAVTRLEARLGIQLAKRTTRTVSLTEEGTLYADRCRAIMAELDEVNGLLTRRRQAPKGKLRIQLPAAEGRNLVIPCLGEFVERYPELRIEFELSGRATELTDETVDVAIRIGEQHDSGLIVRKLCDVEYRLCASPDYLARHGLPTTYNDLASHRCLSYMNPLTGRHEEWRIIKQGKVISLPLQHQFSANGAQALIDAAVAGIGIVYGATAAMREDIASGRLLPVLPDQHLPKRPMYALYLPNRYLSPKVRAIVDFLSDAVPARSNDPL